MIWNNAQEKQRIELVISECTKNEDSELAWLWYHVRIQALIQSSSMEEIKQTTRERDERIVLTCIDKYLGSALYIIGSEAGNTNSSN